MARVRARLPKAVPGIIALLTMAPIIGTGLPFSSGATASAAIGNRPPSAHSAGTPAGTTPPQTNAASLPLNFERHTDDLDAMVKRRNIRALVFYSRSGFFYVNGRPQGISTRRSEPSSRRSTRNCKRASSMSRLRSSRSAPSRPRRPWPREWVT